MADQDWGQEPKGPQNTGEQDRGQRLRQFMQRRQQAEGQGQFGGGGMGGFGRFQGGMGQGQFGGGMGRFGRFQGGMGRFGGFQGGMGQFGGGGQEFGEDIHLMDVEQRAQYRQQLEFRVNWLEKRLAQAMKTLEELDALEAAVAELGEPEGGTAAEASDPAVSNDESKAGTDDVMPR